jgi:hypothetical protein
VPVLDPQKTATDFMLVMGMEELRLYLPPSSKRWSKGGSKR